MNHEQTNGTPKNSTVPVVARFHAEGNLNQAIAQMRRLIKDLPTQASSTIEQAFTDVLERVQVLRDQLQGECRAARASSVARAPVDASLEALSAAVAVLGQLQDNRGQALDIIRQGYFGHTLVRGRRVLADAGRADTAQNEAIRIATLALADDEKVLDNAVLESCAALAARVNDDGAEAQVTFLRSCGWSEEMILKAAETAPSDVEQCPTGVQS